jgi:hypothetical protein
MVVADPGEVRSDRAAVSWAVTGVGATRFIVGQLYDSFLVMETEAFDGHLAFLRRAHLGERVPGHDSGTALVGEVLNGNHRGAAICPDAVGNAAD